MSLVDLAKEHGVTPRAMLVHMFELALEAGIKPRLPKKAETTWTKLARVLLKEPIAAWHPVAYYATQAAISLPTARAVLERMQSKGELAISLNRFNERGQRVKVWARANLKESTCE